MKAAIRTYDSWAKNVLIAEKSGGEMNLSTSTIAMPHLAEDSVPVLSVGWALRALLAGLPNGILGSARLYQTLQTLFEITLPQKTGFSPPPGHGLSLQVAVRAQLISLAVIGLSTEMQRDLICTLFGLLTFLLRPESSLDGEASDNQRSESDRIRRITVRPQVAPPEYQKLVRVFAPLLLGQENRRAVMPGVEQDELELEEQRVATLLLDHWPNVNRQLKTWSKEAHMGGRDS
jgi:hypothetical protein